VRGAARKGGPYRDPYARQGLVEQAIDCYSTALALARMNTNRFSESRMLAKLAAVNPD
jgi:hypothetical protein